MPQRMNEENPTHWGQICGRSPSKIMGSNLTPAWLSVVYRSLLQVTSTGHEWETGCCIQGSEGKRPIGRPRRRRKDLQEVEWRVGGQV
jgi:hypothetical protein